jgi:hypothetical protein
MSAQVEPAARAWALKQASQQQQSAAFPGQDDRDVLLTRAEAAVYLRRSVPTLESWARDGAGPPVTRCGPRGVRYRLSDLRSFVAAGIASQN